MSKLCFCNTHNFTNGIHNGVFKINKRSKYKMKITEIRISISTRYKYNYRNSKIRFIIKSTKSKKYDFLLRTIRNHDRKKYIKYIPNVLINNRNWQYFKILGTRFNNRICSITISGYYMIG